MLSFLSFYLSFQILMRWQHLSSTLGGRVGSKLGRYLARKIWNSQHIWWTTQAGKKKDEQETIHSFHARIKQYIYTTIYGRMKERKKQITRTSRTGWSLESTSHAWRLGWNSSRSWSGRRTSPSPPEQAKKGSQQELGFGCELCKSYATVGAFEEREVRGEGKMQSVGTKQDHFVSFV